MTNRTAAEVNYAASQLIHLDNYAAISASVALYHGGFDTRLITRHAQAAIGSHDVQSIDTLTRIFKAAALSATNGDRPMTDAAAQAIARELI